MSIHSRSMSKKGKGKARFKVAAILMLISCLVIVTLFADRLMRNSAEHLAASMSEWTCENIDVVCGPELTRDSVLAIAGCKLNHPLTSYSTESIKRKLLTSPWIKSVHVERQPPNSLIIQIVERRGIAVVRDGSELAVSEDLVFVPAALKSWKNRLPWISSDVPFNRVAGPMSEKDPLFHIAQKFAELSNSVPELSGNIAELYRVDGTLGAVTMNPVLTIELTPDTQIESWMALDRLLSSQSFQSKLDSNAIIDLTQPGFVTLQLPDIREERDTRL